MCFIIDLIQKELSLSEKIKEQLSMPYFIPINKGTAFYALFFTQKTKDA
jgi:hypothetical protein